MDTLITEKEVETLKITSSAFERKALVPEKYTCEGEDINHPLLIGKVPTGAERLVLIVDDPDAAAN